MMEEETLYENLSTEDLEIIRGVLDKAISFLQEHLIKDEIYINLGCWSMINLSLLLAHKTYPKDKIQNVMNKITIAQNELINKHAKDLN